MNIPINDLKRQYKAIEKPVMDKLSGIFASQSFILGPETEELERRISEYCGTAYAAGVNSGTDALILALAAMGVGEGDEVITTPFTFVATAEAIAQAGARPVFVDVDPNTYNIKPDLIPDKITKRTKAILPVHLYGLPADMDPIIDIAGKCALSILEDCAQAIGSEYKGRKAGSMGDAGTISFYPGKNLGGFGDGGMVVTNSKDICDKIKLLRNHGSSERYRHSVVGYNSRLDDIQSAVLNVKLDSLDEWIEKRIEIAQFFNRELKDLPVSLPSIPEGSRHSFHLYTLRSRKAGEIISYLGKNGIESRAYYPVPLHLMECFSYLGYKKGDLPESEKLSGEVFSIPVYPELSREEIGYIANKIKGFFSDTSRVK